MPAPAAAAAVLFGLLAVLAGAVEGEGGMLGAGLVLAAMGVAAGVLVVRAWRQRGPLLTFTGAGELHLAGGVPLPLEHLEHLRVRRHPAWWRRRELLEVTVAVRPEELGEAGPCRVRAVDAVTPAGEVDPGGASQVWLPPTAPVEHKAARRLAEELVPAVDSAAHAGRTVRMADRSLHRVLDEGGELVVRRWLWIDLAGSLAAIAFFGGIGLAGVTGVFDDGAALVYGVLGLVMTAGGLVHLGRMLRRRGELFRLDAEGLRFPAGAAVALDDVHGAVSVRQPQHFADGLTLTLADDPGSGPFDVETEALAEYDARGEPTGRTQPGAVVTTPPTRPRAGDLAELFADRLRARWRASAANGL